MPKSIKSKTLNLNNNNKIFGYFQPTMRQSLVQLAEVIPTSSGRSSYPPSALTRGRLAHFVHLRTSGFSQCSLTSVSHSVVLHGFLSFFPTLAQGCFPFFISIKSSFSGFNCINQPFEFSFGF